MAYYGYAGKAERKALDWEEISSSISSELIEERDRRQDLKDEIDENSRQFAQLIQDAPQGQSTSFNEKILELSDELSSARLMQDKLLKSGQLKLRDYRLMRQNLSDGLDQLYKFSNSFNEEYAAKMERANSGQASKIESQMMGYMEQLKDFTNSSFMVDPKTGKILVGKNNKNDLGEVLPGLSKGANDWGEIGSLSKRMGMNIDKYDVSGYLKDASGTFGKFLEMFSKAGVYGTIDDITKRTDLDPKTGQVVKSYIKAEESIINASLTNPVSAGSILMDYVGINPETGEEYTITMDPDEAKANPNMVLMGPDPVNPSSGELVPILSNEQKSVARDAMRARLRTMLNKDERIQGRYPARTYNQYQYKRDQGVGKSADMLSSLAQLYYGNSNDMRSALEFIQGQNPDIKDISRTPDGVSFTYERNGQTETVELPFKLNGELRSQRDFLEGAAAQLFGIDNIEEALSRSQYNPDMPFAEDASANFEVAINLPSFQETTIGTGKARISMSDYVRSAVDNIPGWMDTEEDSANWWAGHLTNGIFDAIPSEARSGVDIISDGNKIIMSAPGVETKTFEVTSDTPSEDVSAILPIFEEFFNSIAGAKTNPNQGGLGEGSLDNI